MNGTQRYYNNKIREKIDEDVSFLTIDLFSNEIEHSKPILVQTATRTTVQTVTDPTICLWNSVSVGTAFSESGGTFTCLEPGVYHFLAASNLGGPVVGALGTMVRFALVVNGSDVFSAPAVSNSATTSRNVTMATAVSLFIGDEFFMQYRNFQVGDITSFTSPTASLYIHRL